MNTNSLNQIHQGRAIIYDISIRDQRLNLDSSRFLRGYSSLKYKNLSADEMINALASLFFLSVKNKHDQTQGCLIAYFQAKYEKNPKNFEERIVKFLKKFSKKEFLNVEEKQLQTSQVIIQTKENFFMHHWNWHIAPSENPYEFELFPKTYKNFTVLSCEQISEEEFNIVTKTLSFEEFSVSSVTEFIKDYGRILGFTYTLTPLPLLSNGHLQVPKRIEREIKPLYFIPPHLRTDKERIEINLADINLPHKERQTIIVQMRSLEEINQKIKNKWSPEIYQKAKSFVIYYINQIAIDSEKFKLPADSLSYITDNRIYLAHCSNDEAEASEYLFGEYKGPDIIGTRLLEKCVIDKELDEEVGKKSQPSLQNWRFDD